MSRKWVEWRARGLAEVSFEDPRARRLFSLHADELVEGRFDSIRACDAKHPSRTMFFWAKNCFFGG